MSELKNVSVVKKSNVYFEGKCVSHTVLLGDGTRKTVGVIFPSTLRFNTGAPERMEIVDGHCRIRLAGATDWQDYATGSEFRVPGDSSFEIETIALLDYVCHFE